MKTEINTKNFPIVCVGGSAGGLDAYIRLLKHLPDDMGVAIVIVNHLRTVATRLHEILPHYTQMPVELITEKLDIQPNHVFIIPEKRDLHVLDGEFRLKPISKPRGWPDVAREASSMVLMDDNFSSIVGAIRMGRRIFDNLQKSFGYIFAIHVPIAGLSLLPILLGNFPLILWPVHIVFLELIIDPACSIIFEAEKEESNVMNRPPKGIKEPFFGASKILFSCLQGVGILAISLAVYFIGLYLAYEAKEVRAMAFTTLIVSNIAVILTNRSWTDNIFRIIATPNKAVLWVVGGAIFFLLLILNIPFFLSLFQFQKLTFINIIICSLAGLTTIVWFEIYKLFKLRKDESL